MRRREFLGRACAAAGCVATPWETLLSAAAPGTTPAGWRDQIEAAAPGKAFATPRRPRRLLIFDSNVNYGGHASIPAANLAFAAMGRKTGAFETIVSGAPSIFESASLRSFDAVFFNNNVGNLFEDPALRENLAEFVHGGGGLMGVHGASVAFTRWPGALEDWPEFGLILGARGANHRDSDERVIVRLDDPGHPLTRPWDAPFEYRDEFFRVHEPYSRAKLRVLLSIDTAKTQVEGQPRGDCLRPDNDYALAWIRNYGRGRSFYCTIAHNPRVFWDPRMLSFYLAAAQFVLGDLAAPATPSARLTPGVRALERLGWRLGLGPAAAPAASLAQRVDHAARVNAWHLACPDSLPGGPALPGQIQPGLDRAARRQIRLKLDAAGVRIPVCHAKTPAGGPAGWRALFEQARALGAEVIATDAPAAALDTLEPLCQEFDMNLALESSQAPDALARLCASRGPRVGVCGSTAAWERAGTSLREAVKTLGARLSVLYLHDPGGPGAAAALEALRLNALAPSLIGWSAPASDDALAAGVRQVEAEALRAPQGGPA